MNTGNLTVKISRKWEEALDICGLEFVTDDGSPLPRFSSGSHIDVHLSGGLVRQYSLCDNPERVDRYQIAVLREAEGRGGSRVVHDEIRQGDILQISAPKNHFPLADGVMHHLLFAGGIGVTPILSMAEHLSSSGEAFDMHYCVRSTDRAAFIQRVAASEFEGADKNLDYLEVVHVLVRRPHSSGSALPEVG